MQKVDNMPPLWALNTINGVIQEDGISGHETNLNESLTEVRRYLKRVQKAESDSAADASDLIVLRNALGQEHEGLRRGRRAVELFGKAVKFISSPTDEEVLSAEERQEIDIFYRDISNGVLDHVGCTGWE